MQFKNPLHCKSQFKIVENVALNFLVCSFFPVCPKSVELTCPDSIVSGQYAVVTCRSASSNPRTGFSWTIGGEVTNPTGSRRYDVDEFAGETTTQSHVGTYNKNHNNAQVKCCGSVRTEDSPLTCSDNICDTCDLDVRCKLSSDPTFLFFT